jgi:DNA-binding beta-propeller fold protein YncE
MPGVNRRGAAACGAALTALLALAACGGGGTRAAAAGAPLKPVRILQAPRNLLSAAQPQQNSTMWVLAGDTRSRGLFQLDPSTGHVLGSLSVSNTAQSVAQTSTGLLALALGSHRAGALELLDSRTAEEQRTIPLPAPAREVVVGSDGSTLYVLTAWPSAASVSVVGSAHGHVKGTVPVPRGAVSIAPDIQQTSLYVLQGNGLISQVSISDGKVMSSFRAGDSGQSLAMSPDGTTLYVLKDVSTAPDVAVVDLATQSVRRALPAPAGCVQVVVSPSGSELLDVVGTSRYGNVQVFPV